MAKVNRIKVKKEIYKWAIKESQKDFEEVRARFNKIDDWIGQKSLPTFRQLENLANYLKVPFGYMFLNKPPETDIIESEFRTIGNKLPDISKNLKDTINDMSRKQDWISEHRENKGWDKVIPNDFSKIDIDDYCKFAKKAKEFLRLSGDWYKGFKDNRIAYNFLREKVEYTGILVMQNGIVGSNTHRKLDINEFRGFMLYDDFAPLIFINANDSPAGKVFTLIHEYIHILLGLDDVFTEKALSAGNKKENQINKITAEFLMPESCIKKHWNKREEYLIQIEELSRLFNVSRLALAIRLKELGKIDQSLVQRIRRMTEIDLKQKDKDSSGGNYWANYKSRYSNSFIETVIQGTESGEISYTYAFDLLNIKAKHYDILKEDIISYAPMD